ncbi:acyl-CoA thioesterase [Trinickia mobilis]|uniref:acyl-CoA thioesterase n=1 Tax=Trinickia mobilis TaxID=2816356 RepID=UPI001A8F4ACD|nr:thioesterase family protein [Trinickia mobilis]
MTKRSAAPRAAYPHFLTIPTRWMDNDVYGHVNNVVYYSYFDTVVNEYLIRAGVLDFEGGATIGLVVETQCNYFAPLVFPDRVEAGLRVARLGSSSVRYEVGLFKEGGDDACSQGHFVHVYVDRLTRRPVALPDALRAALEPLAVPALPPASTGHTGSMGDTGDSCGAKPA